MKKQISRMWWRFDRIFGDNKHIFLQIIFILVLIAIVILFIAGADFLLLKLGAFTGLCCGNDILKAIMLFFGSFPVDAPPSVPLWWQVAAHLLGAIFFSGVAITFVSNLLRNRLLAYRLGTVRYMFENHLLFLGGSRIILPMIKTIANDKALRKGHIVVLTTDDVDKVRVDINRYLSPFERKMLKITVLAGDHYDEDTLCSVYVHTAKRIYIVGDYLSGSEHDSENVDCWQKAKKLCSEYNRTDVPCFLYFSRFSSVRLFNHRKDKAGDSLDTTIINFLESVAQRVLVHNGDENNDYIPLDRSGIGPEDKRRVHFIVTGATSASFAMATTAAHLCHFPNSFEMKESEGKEKISIIPSRRTKITFIAPKIKEEMSLIISHLEPLFRLSHYRYICETNDKDNHKPLEEYGDFLDIEWEFIDGNVADEWVVKQLKEYYNDCVGKEETYLTMAFCDKEADRNIAAATYLPSEYHNIYRQEDGSVDYEKTIPLYIYQPDNEKLVHSANKETKFYENMFSFGSMKESYYSSIRQRIEEGKRINYIYNKNWGYQYMTSSQDKLDRDWRKLSYLKQASNIYLANHIGVKLRSMGIDSKALQRGEKIPEEHIERMAIVEHNRWNVEKLLVGFEPMTKSFWKSLDSKQINEYKDEKYIHNCIASFDDLDYSTQDYDRLIVKNLTDVLK